MIQVQQHHLCGYVIEVAVSLRGHIIEMIVLS